MLSPVRLIMPRTYVEAGLSILPPEMATAEADYWKEGENCLRSIFLVDDLWKPSDFLHTSDVPRICYFTMRPLRYEDVVQIQRLPSFEPYFSVFERAGFFAYTRHVDIMVATLRPSDDQRTMRISFYSGGEAYGEIGFELQEQNGAIDSQVVAFGVEDSDSRLDTALARRIAQELKLLQTQGAQFPQPFLDLVQVYKAS